MRCSAASPTLGSRLDVIDLRREAVDFRDGVISERRALPGDPLGYRVVDPRRAQPLRGLRPRGPELPRRRLRPGAHRGEPHRRPARLSALRDRAARRLDRESPEAEDAQEDRRHARAQESRRDQRRQELASPPHRGRGRRRVSRAQSRRPLAELGRGARAAAPRAGPLDRPPARCAPGRGRAARWPLRPLGQLAWQPHDVADVLRPEPLRLLQRRAGPEARRPRAGAPRAHGARRRSWRARARGRWRRATCLSAS